MATLEKEARPRKTAETPIETFLNKVEIFKNLPRETAHVIDKRIRKMNFKKGEQIMSEYEKGEGVFFVQSGVVKLTKQDEKGNEMIVCIKKKGDIFAESCLFNDETNYPATGIMLQAGEIYFLHTEELEQELMASPEMAVHMIRYMSGQLREFTSIMRDIALLDVYAKTIKTIERLAEKFGKSKCNEVLIELPLTVQEFASLIGTSRESVSRVFSKLRKEGLIDIKSKKIIILDWCKFCQSKLKDV